MKLNIVARTCDKHSLQSKRIVNKKECIIRCLNSILENLEEIPEKKFYIVDDNSTEDFREILRDIEKNKDFVSIEYLEPRDDSNLTPRKKTRYSLSRSLRYIFDIPEDELVYLVEDDYLHFPSSIKEMVDVWLYLKEITGTDVGVFPQDFNQLYYHPTFPYNKDYVRPCLVVPTPKRYYRTTWYTQESFMIQSNIFKKYKEYFNALLEIGDENGYNWEGNTISKIWERSDFNMFMPIGSLVVHMSNKYDIPFLINRETIVKLWKKNTTEYSNKKDSWIMDWEETWPKEFSVD